MQFVASLTVRHQHEDKIVRRASETTQTGLWLSRYHRSLMLNFSNRNDRKANDRKQKFWMRNEVRKSAGWPCSNLSHKPESLIKLLCVLWIIRIDCNKLAFTSVIIYLDAYSMSDEHRRETGERKFKKNARNQQKHQNARFLFRFRRRL